jgi:hypothetical protein
MMDKLSNPVAFTSAPLHENDDPIPKQNGSAAVDEEESIRIEREMSSIIESFFGQPTRDKEDEEAYTQNKNPSIELTR